MPCSQRIWITRLPVVPDDAELHAIVDRAAGWFRDEQTTGVALICGRLLFVFSESRTDPFAAPGTPRPDALAGVPPQLLVERRAPRRLFDDWSVGVVDPTPLTDSDPDATNLCLANIWSALPDNATPEQLAQTLLRTDLVLHPPALTDAAA